MLITFEKQDDGAVLPVIAAANRERDQLYCKRYGAYSEVMVDRALMRVEPFIWNAPRYLTCDCGDEACEDCRSGREFRVARHHYELWDHPSLFEAASLALGEQIGACDVVFLIPQCDVVDGMTRDDMAGVVACDLAEIAVTRSGVYRSGAGDPVKRQLVHFAAAALLLKVAMNSSIGPAPDALLAVRDRLIDCALMHLADEGQASTSPAAMASLMRRIWDVVMVAAVLNVPMHPNDVHPTAERLVAVATSLPGEFRNAA